MNPGLWWSSPDRWLVLCRAILALNLFAAANGWFALANLLEVILVSVVFEINVKYLLSSQSHFRGLSR